MKVGERFTRFVVLEIDLRKYGKRAARVRCDCGEERVIPYRHLVTGNTTSCGCRHREVSRDQIVKLSTKHGNSPRGGWSPEYNAWSNMIQRCTNPLNTAWDDYGGRGIRVCDRWRAGFENFLADMGPKPSPEHSIDRIKVNQGYSHLNCRWATDAEQARNKRNTKLTLEQIEEMRGRAIRGVTKARALAAEYGISYGYTIRILNGYWRAA